LGLNRFDEAKAVLEKAEAQGLTLSAGQFARFLLAFIQHDEAGMRRAVDGASGEAVKAIILMLKMQSEYFQGKTKAARQTLSQAIDLSERSGLKEFAAGLVVFGAQLEAEMGNPVPARPAVAKALAMAQDRDTRWGAALLLARIGDSSAAEKMFTNLAKEFPNDTMLKSVWIPIAHSIVEMRSDNPAKAIEVLESARPYELGAGPNSCSYWANYVRGEVYLRARDGRKAAAEYQRILDHRGVDPASPLYSLSRVGLARAYSLQGDTTKARTAYQDFLADWKDADPDVPILNQAKAEYAKLQ
jgi:tetratricopeptide (TPR) repeat protein